MNIYMKSSIREYDAHIYFTSETQPSAEKVQLSMLSEFADGSIQISPLVHTPVGPHPLPMFEAHFKKTSLDHIVQWIEKNRNGHSVLVHPVTENELKDHTESARWFGNPVSLDLNKLFK